MGIYDTIAGAADHAAGSIDESIGRQFDNQPGGGFADLGETGQENDAVLGTGEDGVAYNRYLQGDGVRTIYDTVFEYSGTLNGTEDTADMFGPSVEDVADVAVDVEGEDPDPDAWKTKLFIYGIVAAVALYLLRPVLGVAENLSGDA